jgi:hypothetical protein
MFICKNCGKGFEKETQLRGHLIHCNKKEAAKKEPAEKIKVKEVKKEETYEFDKYMELPPPVIEWLRINFGNWLNHFEVGRSEWRRDFGGYALYIKIPEEYSTEWKKEVREQYDNRLRRPATDEKGNPKRFEHVVPDIRYVSLQMELPKTIDMLERIKDHIISNAHKKGIRLPSIGGEVTNDKTLEDYKKSLYT